MTTSLRFALRTDKAFDAVKALVTEKQMSGIAVREVAGDNEHWHWYLETDKYKKLKDIRNALTRSIPELKGNGAYSVKECDADYEKYWRYICKGASVDDEPEVVFKYGLIWTDDKIADLHEAFWAEHVSNKRRKKLSVFDAVLEECRRQAVAWDDVRQIGRIYINTLVAHNKGINFFAIKSNIRLVQIKLCPTNEAIECVADQLFIA